MGRGSRRLFKPLRNVLPAITYLCGIYLLLRIRKVKGKKIGIRNGFIDLHGIRTSLHGTYPFVHVRQRTWW